MTTIDEIKMFDDITTFQCVCHSPEHNLQIEYDNDVDTIMFTVHLNQYRNIFKRIWVAIKYIFGYGCRYGQWDVFELQRQDITKFKEILEILEKIDTDLPNYCLINNEYVFYKNKQDLINKLTSSKF